MDDLLKTLGLTFEKLYDDEKEEYKRLSRELDAKPPTIEDFKTFAQNLRTHLEKKLCAERDNRERDMLVARMENCLAILAFFETPEQRKKATEAYIKTLSDRIVKSKT